MTCKTPKIADRTLLAAGPARLRRMAGCHRAGALRELLEVLRRA